MDTNYTPIDLMCRNMGLALSIAQKANDAQAAEQIVASFERIMSGLRFRPSLSLPLPHPPPLSEEDIINNAIARAQGIQKDESLNDEEGGWKPFDMPKAYEEDDEDDDYSCSSEVHLPSPTSTVSSDPPPDLDSMLPGQRENYLKTKAMAQGLRDASFHDTPQTRAQHEALGVTT